MSTEPRVLPTAPQEAVANRGMPAWLPALEVFYLVALLVAALARVDNSRMQSILPDPVGSVPLGVIFFGSLGGVTIGLYGLFFHEGNWDSSYNLWHATRPLLGAVLGIVSYLVMVVVLGAAGASPGSRSDLPYFLVAFLVAYSERQFRSLLQTASAKFIPSSKKEPPD